MFRTSFCAAALAGAVALSTADRAAAQTFSDGFTYQGVLNDGGQPANGAYDLEFRVFDAEFVGNQLSPTLTASNQAVTEGLVTQQLEFGPGLFDGSRRWLEVRVRAAGGGAFTALPRQEIRATPHAVFAKSSEVSGFAMTSGTTLQEAFENGAAIDGATGPLRLTDSFESSVVDLFFNDGSLNDGLRLVNDSGSEFFSIAEYTDGSGGFLLINNGGSVFEGFIVDGNAFGTNSTFVGIFGNSSMFFDSSLSGNISVQLPVDSISPSETKAEAGLVHSSFGGG